VLRDWLSLCKSSGFLLSGRLLSDDEFGIDPDWSFLDSCSGRSLRRTGEQLSFEPSSRIPSNDCALSAERSALAWRQSGTSRHLRYRWRRQSVGDDDKTTPEAALRNRVFSDARVMTPRQPRFKKAEVEVNTETGDANVVKMTTAIDAGPIINPQAVEGQLEGGMNRAIGLALPEEYIHGKTSGWRTFKFPTIQTVPDVKITFQETPRPNGTLGATGIGEDALSATRLP